MTATPRPTSDERKDGSMIDFEIDCGRCGKRITLRVRDERVRAFFEEHGALRQVCHDHRHEPAVRDVV
jgi:hypothetical protein